MPRVVLLGTGTGVGKTYVTAAAAQGLSAGGDPVLCLKPVETGFTGDGPSDAATLAAASFHVKHPTAMPLFAFVPPVSPHLAAREAGVAIDLASIADWVSERERENFLNYQQVTSAHLENDARAPAPWTLVESAGGAFSPLSKDLTNSHLAAALEPAILALVAPDRLGVLHDVAATIAAMRACTRAPDLVVLSCPPHTDASTGSNGAELGALGIADHIVGVERNDEHAPATLARALRSCVSRAAGPDAS